MAHLNPYIEIFEQPKSTALRFRYVTESRKAGSIMGEYSSRINQSYPSIKINNYCGPLMAKMFCVTEQGHLHPHKLVGQHCDPDHGVCIIRINEALTDNIIRFSNVGIQCSKRDDIRSYLDVKKKVVPECHEPPNLTMIDLTCVKLMFKVYLGPQEYALDPVMSRVIYDKKHCCDLTITRLSIKSAPAEGDEELFILCNKVKKEDLQVVFSSNSWEGLGIFHPGDVFKDCVVVCKVPAYKNQNIKEPVNVQLFLRQPSNKEIGNELKFTYRPVDQDPYSIMAKKRKMAEHLPPPMSGLPLNPIGGSVSAFSDYYNRHDLQDHGIPRSLKCQIEQWPEIMTHQVSAPDIFNREGKHTVITFNNQHPQHGCNSPFSLTKNPIVPLPVEEANTKGRNSNAKNLKHHNDRTPSEQVVEIKSESLLDWNNFFPEHSNMPSATRSQYVPTTSYLSKGNAPNPDALQFWNIQDPSQNAFCGAQNFSSQMYVLSNQTSSSNQMHLSSNQMHPSKTSLNHLNRLIAYDSHPILPSNQLNFMPAPPSYANPLLAPSSLEQDLDIEELVAFPELDENFGSLNLDDHDLTLLNDFLRTGS